MAHFPNVSEFLSVSGYVCISNLVLWACLPVTLGLSVSLCLCVKMAEISLVLVYRDMCVSECLAVWHGWVKTNTIKHHKVVTTTLYMFLSNQYACNQTCKQTYTTLYIVQPPSYNLTSHTHTHAEMYIPAIPKRPEMCPATCTAIWSPTVPGILFRLLFSFNLSLISRLNIGKQNGSS